MSSGCHQGVIKVVLRQSVLERGGGAIGRGVHDVAPATPPRRAIPEEAMAAADLSMKRDSRR